MGTYLDDIVARHRLRASQDRRVWQDRKDAVTPRESRFADSLMSGDFVSVIAEVKRKSPSKGWLAPDIDASQLAQTYEHAGASAISVLTDQEGFGGTIDDLVQVNRTTNLPLLRKDFTVSENDVLDAFDAGADAVLLIVAALSDTELRSLHTLGTELGLDVLVEVHSRDEISRATNVGAKIIGINQRNLQTFDVDPAHAAELAASLPQETLKVCESGLRTADDVRVASQAGFSAVLVGEVFVTSEDIPDRVRSFASVPRA